MKHGIISVVCLLCIGKTTLAQNTTNLPTSMYGIGELSMGDGGQYAGIGSMGIALNRIGFQNTINPAAITRMDTLCYTFDVGATFTTSRYSFQGKKSGSTTGNPIRVNIGCRLMKRWYAMAGIAPYSSVGYYIRNESEVEGTNGSIINSYFMGSGGLYKCYLTNSFEITKRLSAGANIGLITGTTTQQETQEKATVTYESRKRAFYLDVGLFYEFPSTSSTKWAFGAVYAPSMPMAHDNNLIYYNDNTTEEMEGKYYRKQQYLPQRIGGGASMTTPRIVLTADYNWIDWRKNNSSGVQGMYDNQHKANLGCIYVVHPKKTRSVELMAGIGYSNSYIMLKNGKMSYLEANAGISIPILYSFLGVSAFYRKQLNSRQNLMQETRVGMNLNITFGERISRFKLK